MNRRAFISGMGITAAGGFAAGCARDRRPRLNVFNWSSYIDPEMIAAFERERGVRIRLVETAHDSIGVDVPEDVVRVEASLGT